MVELQASELGTCPLGFLFEGRAEGDIGETIGGAWRDEDGGVADEKKMHTSYEL